MHETRIAEAAALLWQCWRDSRRIATLPERGRPPSRAEGYAIQAQIARLSGERVLGWKIAATSAAGARHIHVDGPLAGRLLARYTVPAGGSVPLSGNLMRLGEAEFAFRMGTRLPPREAPYSVDEVMDAVRSLHPALEFPDTRFADCTAVGEAQLIADNACAGGFVLGAASGDAWRERDLAGHAVIAMRDGSPACEGKGANVLGDPRLALAWIANELRSLGEGLAAGDVVTTGTCVVPFAIAPGERIRADFGEFGSVEAALTD